jgi:hypothetical protein
MARIGGKRPLRGVAPVDFFEADPAVINHIGDATL